jgi:putative phosphoesterase
VEERLMRVGVMADSHDRVPAIAEILRRMSEAGVGFVLHAGDYCSPFALAPFRDMNIALAGVFGRNDGDREGLKAAASSGVGAELYESPHSVELDGQRVLLVHDLGDVAARSIEAHAIVVHGWSHRAEVRTHGDSLIVNPGEACGWLHGTPTAVIIDLATKQVDHIRLTEADWRC